MKRFVMVAAVAALVAGCGSPPDSAEAPADPAAFEPFLAMLLPSATPVDRGPCLPFEIRLRIDGCPMVLV